MRKEEGTVLKTFEAEIKKDDSGRLTVIELPFHAREAFCKSKGTIFVKGTINGIEYRSKLLSRGNDKFIMVLDKALQKAIFFDGNRMTAHITMTNDSIVPAKENNQEPVTVTSNMDVLSAIKTRQSIRKFTSEPISEEILNTILYAGLCAPTAKNKRPYHFVMIRNRQILLELAENNMNASMLNFAPCAVVICGDKNMEGTKEFLYSDCASATQNMLLAIHGLGLGGIWCGVVSNSDWQKLLIQKLSLPLKLEPVAVLALGYPDEAKELSQRWESEKIHYDKW